MAVNATHQKYNEHAPRWEKVRDCIKGEDTIKAAGIKYLPKPIGWTEEAYSQYLERARFSNFTGRTADGLHGSIFSNLPEQPGDMSERFKAFLENVDNAGTSIYKFASEFCADTLPAPWGGILVDHPTVQDGMNANDAERLGIKAYLKQYSAESYINYAHSTANGQTVLSMVVLLENYEDRSADKFTPIVKTRYRVLRLTNGVYTQQVYEQSKDNEKEFLPGALITPEIDGKAFNFIPFFPVAMEPKKSILLDLANENLGHYRKSADLENSLHMLGVATPWASVKDIPIDEKTGEPKTVTLGGGSFLWLPEGTASYLEPSGNGLSHSQRSMDASEQHMKLLGAKPFESGPKGVEAAATVRMHNAAANSVLGSFAIDRAEVITNAVRLGARWRGVDDAEVEKWNFNLNTIYDGDIAKVEEKRLALEMIDDGVMSRVKFLMDYMGMEEADAKAEVERIREEEGYEPME